MRTIQFLLMVLIITSIMPNDVYADTLPAVKHEPDEVYFLYASLDRDHKPISVKDGEYDLLCSRLLAGIDGYSSSVAKFEAPPSNAFYCEMVMKVNGQKVSAYISRFGCFYSLRNWEGASVCPAYKPTYSCPPDQNQYSDTANYTEQTNYDGSKNSEGLYCSEPCSSSYPIREGNECVTYCPTNDVLDATTNLCVKVDNDRSKYNQCHSPSVPLQAADPVIIEDGTLYEAEMPDYMATGHFPLVFGRTYHSHNSTHIPMKTQAEYGWKRHVQPHGYTGIPHNNLIYITSTPHIINGNTVSDVQKVPGYGYQLWRNNFSYTLDTSNANRMLLIPPQVDENVAFIGNGITLTANNLTGETLTKNTDATSGAVTWVYRDRANFVRVFNSAGLLITEQDVSGLAHHLAYDVAKRLIAVSDDFGHTLSFSYDDYGRISVMTTPVGSVTYGYDDKGNLTSVTKVAGSDATTRTYVYDDSRFSYALTGIIDEKGVRYTSWVYDDSGKVIENHGINNSDKTIFSYTNDSTIVTNPLGKTDVYTYGIAGYSRRLFSVNGQASTSCLAANKYYDYLPNGLLFRKTDFKGTSTLYEYNDRGLVTKQTEVAEVGAQNARVTTTEWHSTFALPLKVTQGNQTVTYTYDSQGRLTGQSVSGQ